MNTKYSTPHAREQRGMSLVELMIAMTLGLILLTALAYFFLGSRQLNRTHDDVSRMQESSRYALEILGKAIRQAGYRTDVGVLFSPGVALAATDSTTAPDTITLQYHAQDEGEADCAGTNFVKGALVTHAFAINGTNQLTCNNQVVADNIDDMQITYGIDADRNGVIESYQAGADVTDFSKVAAVRVSLLVIGTTTNVATGNQIYTYNNASVTQTDKFLRQVYTATFTVRNQAG